MLNLAVSFLICTAIILAQGGNSNAKPLGNFFGPCPSSPINASSSSSVNDIKGKWYTHFVYEASLWNAFRCHSTEISQYGNQEKANIDTTFQFLNEKNTTEWKGIVETVDTKQGKFLLNFTSADGENTLPITTDILQLYEEGAALVWTCVDYEEFHLENLAILTKYQDPNDKRIDQKTFDTIKSTLKEAGFDEDDETSIDQSNC